MFRITRTGRQYSDQLRKYKVILNGYEIGKIASGEIFDYTVKPGSHTLLLKIDWCTSNHITFQVRDNESIEFKCGGLSGFRMLLALWYITFSRNRYLWIRKV